MYLRYPLSYRAPFIPVSVPAEVFTLVAQPVPVPVAVPSPVHVPVAIFTPVAQPVPVAVAVPASLLKPVIKVETSKLTLKEVPVKRIVKELQWKIEKGEDIIIPCY